MPIGLISDPLIAISAIQLMQGPWKETDTFTQDQGSKSQKSRNL
jgi:hypothetical protein